MSDYLKLGLESLQTAAVQVLGVLVSIPMLAVTARWLGPHGRGEFVACTTWASLAATCCGMSLGMVAIHEMTLSAGGRLKALLGTLLILALALSVVGWTGATGLFHFDRGAFGGVMPASLALAFAAVPFLVIRDYLSSLLIADGRVPLWNLAQLLGTLLSFLIVAMLAIAGTLSVRDLILAWFAGHLLLCGISYAAVHRSAGGIRIDVGIAKSLFAGGIKLHLNTIAAIVISSIDILMVNSYVGTHEVGYYQLAMKLVVNVALIAQAVGAVTYGRVVKLGPDGAWPLVRFICAATMVVVVAGSAVAAWVAPLLVKVIGGQEFAPSVPLFRLMLIAVPGISLSYLMAPQWICRGLFWQSGLLTVISAGLNALANLILVPHFGAVGAAYSYLAVYAVSIAANGSMFVFCEWRWRALKTAPAGHAATMYRSQPLPGI